MMKIGIITLVGDNYGNKFQNYAVEQLLGEYGQVVTYRVQEQPRAATVVQQRTLLQKLRPAYIREVFRCRLMYRYDITNTERSILGNLWYVQTHKKALLAAKDRRSRKFAAYQQDFLHLSPRVITFENCREPEWNESHDLFVCGSDQIWNPTYATTSELAFLSFARGKALALAPSFGLSEIPEDAKDSYKTWLGNIDVLSVREEAGQRIIRDLTGRGAVLLLDPTMAIEPAHWEALAKAPETNLPERYILTYFLGRVNRDYKKKIRQISRQTGLPVVNLFDIEQPDYYSFDPNEVLYAIRHASLVLTDSFHGTVFSILFRRDFLVFQRNEGKLSMSSRLTTLLKKFGLEARMLSGEAVPAETIPASRWEEVARILDQERRRTRAYVSEGVTNLTKK